MLMNQWRSALLVIAAIVLSSCGLNSSPTATIDASRVVESWDEPGEEEIQLLISNQSGADTSADVTVEVDGELVLTQRFETGDFHNFFAFNVNDIEPGSHTITIRSDEGHERNVVFDKTTDPIWIVLHYWPEESNTGFTQWQSDEPVEFA